jgi:hypothetical protein
VSPTRGIRVNARQSPGSRPGTQAKPFSTRRSLGQQTGSKRLKSASLNDAESARKKREKPHE